MAACEHLQLQRTACIHVGSGCGQVSGHFQTQQWRDCLALRLSRQSLQPLRALRWVELAANGLRSRQLRDIALFPSVHELGQHFAVGLRGQAAQRVLGRFHRHALGSESCIAQTRATRCKAFSAAFAATISTWFAITAKARLIAKLAARLAIAATARWRCVGAFLARSVIPAHCHHGAWSGFGFD